MPTFHVSYRVASRHQPRRRLQGPVAGPIGGHSHEGASPRCDRTPSNHLSFTIVVVVTAASSNHAGALRYLLGSLRALNARVDCYDLGLTDAERRALPR